MKNIKLIVFIISLMLTIALLVTGLIFAQSDAHAPSEDQNIPPTTIPTTPTETKLCVPNGTYYYIMGTTTAYSGDESQIETLTAIYPSFTFTDGQYSFCAITGDVNGTAELNDNLLVFNNPQDIQTVFPISVEHDDMWHALYYPKATMDWECTYNAATQTITIKHNSDFAEFKYFDSTEQYAQYLRITFVKDGVFEIYPTPHKIEGDIPGITPSN